METSIFTDGSSRGNPGNGGWGVVVCAEVGPRGGPTSVREFGGFEANTTNNRMELRAAIEGLRDVGDTTRVVIYSDSRYVINGFTKWIKGWKKNGWKTKTKDDVSNRDLWEELEGVAKGKEISWKYVGGHVGVAGNERCDVIATSFADGEPVELYNGSISGYSTPRILDISQDVGAEARKSRGSSRSKAKAYSYVSCVGGTIKIHHSWADCEKRVKGVRGAKFKKALSKEEEEGLVREFRFVPR